MSELEPQLQTSGNLVKPSNSFDCDVETLASQLHDSWRASRQLKDGSYEPREKTTEDQAWIETHGLDRLDIANTAFEDLPTDWRRENEQSAVVALGDVYKIAFYGQGEYGGRNFLSFNHFVEWTSEDIHDGWLKRNGQWAPPEQKLPYGELSELEKSKDRTIEQAAAVLVKNEMDNGSFEVPKEMIMAWLKEDAKYLSDRNDRQAFDAKKAAGRVHPSVTFESLQADSGGWGVENMIIEDKDDKNIYFHVDIPQDRVSIDGIFSAGDVAKFLRKIRNNTPDLTDSHNFSHYTPSRREAADELLEKHNFPLAA